MEVDHEINSTVILLPSADSRIEGKVHVCARSTGCNRLVKDIEILAIILVPLIMTLSRGHTGQIKRAVVMR